MPRRRKKFNSAQRKTSATQSSRNNVNNGSTGSTDWFSSAFGQRSLAAAATKTSTSSAASSAEFAATLLAEIVGAIADEPSEALKQHLERFRDILAQLHAPVSNEQDATATGKAAAVSASVLTSLENTIQMSTGVVGVKPFRKKMVLLLKHQLKVKEQQKQEAARKAREKSTGPTLYTLDSDHQQQRIQPRQPVPSEQRAHRCASSDSDDEEKPQRRHELDDDDDDMGFDEDLGAPVDPHVGDLGSVWGECRAEGEAWGGRGRGGRGIARQHQCMSLYTRDIILRAVSLSFGGKELLEDAELRIVHGHRYGLIGDNGVGKSTLLRQLANYGIPGQPLHLRCLYVKQEIAIKPDDTRTTAQALVEDSGVAETREETQTRIRELIQAIDSFEFTEPSTTQSDGNDSGSDSVNDEEVLAEMHERLSELEDELADLADDRLLERAETVLTGLGFTSTLVHGPVAALSGGWRMRLAIAQAFFQRPAVLLLDEPTNHLDIDGVLWLQNYLTDPALLQAQSVVVVSHDRAFLQAVATDIIVFKDHKLTEFAGTIAEYYAAKDESQRFKLRLLDQRVRQESKAKASIQKAQQRAQQQARKGGKKHVNEKAQKQLKQQKNKLGRIGLYREDGKRYKQFSLNKLDERAVRLASKISGADIEQEKKELKFTFGAPTTLRSGADEGDLIFAEHVSCGYQDRSSGAVSEILHDVTLRLEAGARVALVGPNGAGKSTLVKLLHGKGSGTINVAAATSGTVSTSSGSSLPPQPSSGLEVDSEAQAAVSSTRKSRGALVLTGGTITRAPGVRTGLVQQHHIAALGKHANKTGVEYLSSRFGISPLDARSHLGKFGLVGDTGITKIRALSGGQQMRLYLASIFHDPPHLLILDEPTNHLDMDALDALGRALQTFEGAVVVISHNQHFCSQFCTSLYEVDEGGVSCVHAGDDPENFDAVFTKYKARKFEHMSNAGARAVDLRAVRSLSTLDDPGHKRGTRKVAGSAKQTALF